MTAAATNGAVTNEAVDGEWVLDVEALDLGDLCDIEDAVGIPAGEIMAAAARGSLPARAMLAMVWVAGRRRDPGFSLDDARKVRLTALGGGGTDD